MNKSVIEVKNISKKYALGLTKHISIYSKKQPDFWALKNVSFNINPGEVVGIIGRNGAGKSTLLKLMSRISFPTEGEIVLRGKVASLLEVGTGFNPELTGRENVFLNGAILGIKQKDIKKHFEEIVDFAGVEKFIDTPVKHYSSGMYTRLAFAVASHVEADILLVDEVLSLGDIQFQKKSMGKMEKLAKNEGRTVLFVSHNPNAIEQLCHRCLLLEAGKLTLESYDVPKVVGKYIFGSTKNRPMIWNNSGKQYQNRYFTPLKFYFTDSQNRILKSSVGNNTDFWVHVEAKITNLNPALTFGYAVYSENGQTLFWSYQTDGGEKYWPKIKSGKIHVRSRVPARLFTEAEHKLELIAAIHLREWILPPGGNVPVIHLNIQGGFDNSYYWMTKRPGIIAPVFNWETVCS